jgi:hypothetical protein
MSYILIVQLRSIEPAKRVMLDEECIDGWMEGMEGSEDITISNWRRVFGGLGL